MGCKGKLPKSEFARNNMEKYCPQFLLNEWRDQMFKVGGNEKL
jgi:hypothetical protein